MKKKTVMMTLAVCLLLSGCGVMEPVLWLSRKRQMVHTHSGLRRAVVCW